MFFGAQSKRFCLENERNSKYPLLGLPDKPGFTIQGPLFRVGSVTLFPAPGHWILDAYPLRPPQLVEDMSNPHYNDNYQGNHSVFYPLVSDF
jgi:hypothetical protein